MREIGEITEKLLSLKVDLKNLRDEEDTPNEDKILLNFSIMEIYEIIDDLLDLGLKNKKD